ncbi:MAG: DUF934 domain-containing protein [Maritimibacter sp.]|nr:DUF934 domain-containing protein [Maritimibacter sp.]
MSVIVTDDGFGPEDWTAGFAPVEALGDRSREALALDLSADLLPEALHALVPAFGRIALIRIPFASFADGRGFTLARQLRLLGYRGRLRAAGHVIADQYAMARRSGFDEVEIDADLAARQPEAQWRARADWQRFDYRARLGAQPVGTG